VGCRTRLAGEDPVPGLVHVCRYCAAIQVFGGGRQFRKLTDEERQLLPAEILKEHEDIVRYNEEREEWEAVLGPPNAGMMR